MGINNKFDSAEDQIAELRRRGVERALMSMSIIGRVLKPLKKAATAASGECVRVDCGDSRSVLLAKSDVAALERLWEAYSEEISEFGS